MGSLAHPHGFLLSVTRIGANEPQRSGGLGRNHCGRTSIAIRVGPCLALHAKGAPAAENQAFEIKLVRYRLIVLVQPGRVRNLWRDGTAVHIHSGKNALYCKPAFANETTCTEMTSGGELAPGRVGLTTRL